VLGGTWSTYTAGTNNVRLYGESGSRVMSIANLITDDVGEGRCALISGLSDPIESDGRGILFFRFRIAPQPERLDKAVYAFAGLTDRVTATLRPTEIRAGFGVSGPAGAEQLDLVTAEDEPKVLGQIRAAVWYNVWIVADNAAHTYALYLRPAEGPGGPATPPTPSDCIVLNQPFGTVPKGRLQGAMFMCPTTTAATQHFEIAEIHWDGNLDESRKREL
jgi:hypothetical protein